MQELCQSPIWLRNVLPKILRIHPVCQSVATKQSTLYSISVRLLTKLRKIDVPFRVSDEEKNFSNKI